MLLSGCVSKGLGTTESTNLIGWNRCWKRSRFSHLDRHLDRLCFAVKKSQTKVQKYRLFSFNKIYLWQCQKVCKGKKRKVKRTSRLPAHHRLEAKYRQLLYLFSDYDVIPPMTSYTPPTSFPGSYLFIPPSSLENPGCGWSRAYLYKSNPHRGWVFDFILSTLSMEVTVALPYFETMYES